MGSRCAIRAGHAADHGRPAGGDREKGYRIFRSFNAPVGGEWMIINKAVRCRVKHLYEIGSFWKVFQPGLTHGARFAGPGVLVFPENGADHGRAEQDRFFCGHGSVLVRLLEGGG